MKFFKLAIVWITPALIAGALGWTGIWGGSSALFDYLIPVPVAGGVLHVPSFIVASLFILGLEKSEATRVFYIFMMALGVALAAQTLQLDFDKLNAWFFTDYVPARSPLDFDGNPLFLFIACDALWVAFFALRASTERNWGSLLLLPLVPLAIIGVEAINYKMAGTQIKYGFARPAEERGNMIAMLYTNGAYDEELFRNWIKDKHALSMPWENPNSENLAAHFTSSMQGIKWGNADVKKDIIATLCYYEEDMSSSSHRGYYDCFAGRTTLEQAIKASIRKTDTGLGPEIDKWYARARLCEGRDMSDEQNLDIQINRHCFGIGYSFAKFSSRMLAKFGENSEQLIFLKEKAGLLGLSNSD